MTYLEPIGVYDKLLRNANRKGISLRSLCKELGINYISLSRWKRTEPECFRIHHALNALLEKKESKYKNVLT